MLLSAFAGGLGICLDRVVRGIGQPDEEVPASSPDTAQVVAGCSGLGYSKANTVLLMLEAQAKDIMGHLTSALAEAQAKEDQLAADVAPHKADQVEAKESLAKATALGEREAPALATAQSDLQTNIAALVKATKMRLTSLMEGRE